MLVKAECALVLHAGWLHWRKAAPTTCSPTPSRGGASLPCDGVDGISSVA